MDVNTAIPTESADGMIRDARGEWRPDYPCAYAPVLVWPPQPMWLFKWLFRYGGYLWPWHLLYSALAVVTWMWFTPSARTCATLSIDWIAMVFARNLVLLWIVAGGWHLLLYTLRLHGTKNKYDKRWLAKNSRTFLFGNQLADNIFWSCAAGCTTWTAYEVLLLWASANGHLPFVSWEQNPVYCTLWLLLIPIWREFHFYWIHRAIHFKPLYKYVHYLHHKNINPGPWSGLAMHPGETLVYFSMVLIHFVVPSHPIHLLYSLQFQGLRPAEGHHGFEGPLFDGKLPTGSYFHYIHHRYFECNYGDSIIPLDRWFGTFRDGQSVNKPRTKAN